ncbi:hypothetical protein J7E38_10600 [Bacillus sp. ISL-35]|uniref:hypothetical protein n=1 Tax=Bacillus sp. ISL-35 TaxID=2819122 RepID=UPI001BE9E9CC|nr:hypothetical protein [Bacillus sp. ISL-35]MBT2679452.1 hypothetical protein [Bacillus sp. ISL-35]MBT2703355.1 hypothetical protein [Chryseobacterium sp. ISL-80]
MRGLVLFLLTLLLGLMVFLNIEMDQARKSSNEVKYEYFTEEYTINKVDSSGYYGEGNGKTIYFKKEKVQPGETIGNGDKVIVYFDKSGRIDGPVRIEKTE